MHYRTSLARDIKSQRAIMRLLQNLNALNQEIIFFETKEGRTLWFIEKVVSLDKVFSFSHAISKTDGRTWWLIEVKCPMLHWIKEKCKQKIKVQSDLPFEQFS